MLWKNPIRIDPLGFCPDKNPDTDGRTIIVTDANGMYPTVSGARVLPTLVPSGVILPSPALESFLSTNPTGGVNIFVGTVQHLYQLAGGPIEADNGIVFDAESWDFAQFGTDCIAVDGTDPVQVFLSGATFFTPLVGSPPVAKYVVSVDPGAGGGSVVILANLATDPTGWVSSKPGDDTVWTLNVNDLSASGFLQSTPGPITGLSSILTYALAFKKNSLYIGVWAGPPFVWNWQPVSNQVGTVSNDSIVQLTGGSGYVSDQVAFMGPDDFYTFDGATVRPIPNMLKEWFFGTSGLPGMANVNYMNTVKGRYDPTSSVVFWHFSSVNASPVGTIDTYICWNRRAGNWGVGHLNIETPVVGGYFGFGTTYDQFCDTYLQYENLPHVTYDSTLFQPKSSASQALILTDNQLYSYTGQPSNGYIQFGDMGVAGHLTQINNMYAMFGVYPTAASTASVFSHKQLGAPLVSRVTGVPLDTRSNYAFRVADFWQQIQLQFTSDAEIQALLPDARDAGTR